MGNFVFYNFEVFICPFVRKNTKTRFKHNTLTPILDLGHKEKETTQPTKSPIQSGHQAGSSSTTHTHAHIHYTYPFSNSLPNCGASRTLTFNAYDADLKSGIAQGKREQTEDK